MSDVKRSVWTWRDEVSQSGNDSRARKGTRVMYKTKGGEDVAG